MSFALSERHSVGLVVVPAGAAGLVDLAGLAAEAAVVVAAGFGPVAEAGVFGPVALG